MKRMNLVLAMAAVVLFGASCNQGGGNEDVADTPATPQNQNDSLSYFYGIMLYSQFNGIGVDINPDMLKAGMEARKSGTPLVSDEVAGELAQTAIRDAQMQQQAVKAEKNLAEGEAFLAENGQREGVMTTASGLQYEVITEGNDTKPVATDRVLAHYEGTLIDGTKFDSSFDRGQPTEFPLNGVIAGWTEGLQLMGEGAKYKFYIPYNLAYGANGRPPTIGPNATLLFTVELVTVNP